jgi:hypothetical protein
MNVKARTALSVLLAFVVACAVAVNALATTASGHQNARYLVTARLSPDTVFVHGDFWATVTVKNTSDVQRTLSIQYGVIGPSSGYGAGFAGVRLRPGQVWRRMFNVHAGVRGGYGLQISAHDGRGTSSATAHARAG